MNSCIFCKIIHGELPALKLYEDERILAFLDHRPVREGHAMVIPKSHIDHFIDLPDELASHIVLVGQKIARNIQRKLNPRRVGFAVAGFGVAHAHYHVVPMWEEFDVTSSQYAAINDGKIIFTMDHIPLVNVTRQQQIAELLKL